MSVRSSSTSGSEAGRTSGSRFAPLTEDSTRSSEAEISDVMVIAESLPDAVALRVAPMAADQNSAEPAGVPGMTGTVTEIVLDPLDGGDSPPLPGGSPGEWAAAAVARRDTSLDPSGIGSVASPAPGIVKGVPADIFANPITVGPVVPELADGILQGVVEAESSRGFELTYTIVEDPTEGGKVDLINSTDCRSIIACAVEFPDARADSGDFTLLPDLSVLKSGGGHPVQCVDR